MTTRRNHPTAQHFAPGENERGSVQPYLILFFGGILLMVGLIVDPGAQAQGFIQAQSVAEAAARAGAGAVNGSTVLGGRPTVSRVAAQNAAQSYITASGLQGTVNVNADTVTVTVTKQNPTKILSAVGINSLQSKATATAQILKQ